jgi:hypothetical protein
MYLVVIAWIYVVLMMSVAEATNTTGTVLGAIVTFVLYGLGPVALVIYLMRAPARNKALKKRRAEELVQHRALADASPESQATPSHPTSNWPSSSPDSSSHAASGPEAVALDPGIAPVRKEP